MTRILILLASLLLVGCPEQTYSKYVYCVVIDSIVIFSMEACLSQNGRPFFEIGAARVDLNNIRKLTRRTPTPQPKPTLTVRSSPTNAKVYIDSNYKGTTTLKIQLSSGNYSVRVRKSGYTNFSRRIELKKSMVLRATLTKKEAPKPKPKPKPKYKLIGTGTGFAVNKNYVVTAEHVLDECNAVSIVRAHEEMSAQTVSRDKKNDLGLLKLEKRITTTAKLRGNPDLRVGDAAINYGYPLFGELSDSAKLNAGYVNSLAGYNNDSGVIQYSAPTQPGNSGGPVLDQSGNVIGVVSSGLSKRYAEKTGHIAQNVNFAIKSTILEGFLRSNKVPYETADSTVKLELPDIAEKAERFTVLVGCWE